MEHKRLNVLLIEDNDADALLIREYLHESNGTRIHLERKETLADGLKELAATPPDITLLDMTLPDSAGADTFKRAHEAAPHIPFIVLTHLNDEEMALQMVHSGAQDYLVKGDVDAHLLIRAIRYAIERKKLGEKLTRYAEQLHERNAQLTDDLDMAREVQQALLPQTYPEIPPPRMAASMGRLRFDHRYRPSAAVGGDFFNVDAVSETCAGVFVCDVMGHGMRGALVTAIIRGLLEKLRPYSQKPSAFLTEVNRSLAGIFRRTDRLMFASALYVVVDIENGIMKYANAGHPGPVLVNRRSGHTEHMSRRGTDSGPALGLFSDAVYGEAEHELRENDLFLLYTDGLYEAVNQEGEEFSQERLMQSVRRHMAVPPGKILDGIIGDVETFAGQETFEDDICLLSVAFDAPSGGA